MTPVFNDVFTEIAVLLLFVVGLKLDLHIIRTMGPVALATGLGQVVFTSLIVQDIVVVLLHGLREHGYKGGVAVTAHATIDVERLKQAGADCVLIPYADAATEAVDKLFGVNAPTI